MKPEPESDRLLTVTETAKALNTGTRFVRRLIAERRIWYTHLGSDLLRTFRTADLWLIHAADCRSRYSFRTCCGVRY
jgi:excisionase family DNA binding protein